MVRLPPALLGLFASRTVHATPTSHIESTAALAPHFKRLFDSTTEYAISVTLNRGAIFKLANGEWSSPMPLFSKLVQKFALTKSWSPMDYAMGYDPHVVYDFVLDQRQETSVSATWKYADQVKYSQIALAWWERVNLDGLDEAERTAAYPYNQCCQIHFETAALVWPFGRVLSLGPANFGTEVRLACGRDFAAVRPPTPECLQFYKISSANFAYTALPVDQKTELLDADLSPIS
ncbi:uncharacterized protein L969DRAFT_97253 [Mixia osmundae IAM 14324]|uniref:Uncharacterized protein n=1 Tax=Mixia osmundae (strain CBS 9802 / IAM 14324 / JCM 22182 / KY 12970) TaxID=764103 RepID=G7DW95_MIXOS|nr:uncharacterized protein L969DRAFT_97253 [Mixia osmundae IAM 14324]KEI36518.1 hypothetical protein L969DRAFT_97253 [Mixia osmundae IAM 14324]GAA94783.1 hypothetical protein E5Q_01437 [Mixia osmundae IAM 14324]